VSFEKRSVWINPSFILILTSVRRTEIKTQLRKRGYTNDMVEKQLKKVDNLDRENLLQYNTKKQNNRVPLVITYSKAFYL
jgi:hypothetical protein